MNNITEEYGYCWIWLLLNMAIAKYGYCWIWLLLNMAIHESRYCWVWIFMNKVIINMALNEYGHWYSSMVIFINGHIHQWSYSESYFIYFIYFIQKSYCIKSHILSSHILSKVVFYQKSYFITRCFLL